MTDRTYTLTFSAYDPESKFAPDSDVAVYNLLSQAVFSSQAKMNTPLEVTRAAKIQELVEAASVDMDGPRGPYTILNPEGATIVLTEKELLSVKEDWRALKAQLGKGQARQVLAVDQFLAALKLEPEGSNAMPAVQ